MGQSVGEIRGIYVRQVLQVAFLHIVVDRLRNWKWLWGDRFKLSDSMDLMVRWVADD